MALTPQTFEEFDRYMDQVAKFGETIAAEMLKKNQKLKLTPENAKSFVDDLLNEQKNVFSDLFGSDMDKSINKTLKQNSESDLKAFLQPISKEQNLALLKLQDPSTQPTKTISLDGTRMQMDIEAKPNAMHPLLEKVSGAIRDSILDAMKQNTNTQKEHGKEFLHTFDSVTKDLENRARNEYKLRLAARMTPSRKPSKPRPE